MITEIEITLSYFPFQFFIVLCFNNLICAIFAYVSLNFLKLIVFFTVLFHIYSLQYQYLCVQKSSTSLSKFLLQRLVTFSVRWLQRRSVRLHSAAWAGQRRW
jgi:hypothetical protein